nr:hypothetical protein [Tanacetum cinerariifolium]
MKKPYGYTGIGCMKKGLRLGEPLDQGLLQQARKTGHINITNSFNNVSSLVSTVGPSFANTASPSPINAAGTPASTNAFEEHLFEQFSPFKNAFSLPHVPIVTSINNTGFFGNAYDGEVVEEEVDMNNVVSSYIILDAPLTKFLKDQVIGLTRIANSSLLVEVALDLTAANQDQKKILEVQV